MDTRTGDTHTIYLGEKSGGRGTIHNLFQMMEIMLGSLAIWFFLEPTKARSREVDFKEKVKWMVKEGVSKMRGRRLPQQERTSVELPRPAAEESIAVSGADMKTDHLRLSQEELRHDGEKRGYTRHVHLGRSLDETL